LLWLRVLEVFASARDLYAKLGEGRSRDRLNDDVVGTKQATAAEDTTVRVYARLLLA